MQQVITSHYFQKDTKYSGDKNVRPTKRTRTKVSKYFRESHRKKYAANRRQDPLVKFEKYIHSAIQREKAFEISREEELFKGAKGREFCQSLERAVEMFSQECRYCGKPAFDCLK